MANYSRMQLFVKSDEVKFRRPKEAGAQPYKFENPGESVSARDGRNKTRTAAKS